MTDNLEQRARELLAEINSIGSEQRYSPETQHQRKLRAITTALKGQPASSGWEGIETAPKDGTEVDLWLVDQDGRGDRVTSARWVVGYEDSRMIYAPDGSYRTDHYKRDGWWDSTGGYGDGGFCDEPRYFCPHPRQNREIFTEATHWMPLPAPPPPPQGHKPMNSGEREAFAKMKAIAALSDYPDEHTFRGACLLGPEYNLTFGDLRAIDEALSTRTQPPTGEGARETYAEWQQKRGRAADLIDWAINEFDGWMIDDHFDARAPLDRIIERFREYRGEHPLAALDHGKVEEA